MPRLKAAALTLSLATLLAPAFGQGMNAAGPGSNEGANARPGTVNYVEGQAALGGRAISQRAIGTLAMNAGQTLSTADGRVEVLLTPGVFLRLDHDTTVKMVTPDLTRTEVEVDRGRADLEVDALYKQNNLLVDDATAQAKILKPGLYEFDANPSQLRVFDGKAAVSPSQDAKKWIDVRGWHALALNGTPDKERDFNKSVAENDGLYAWSSLRSDYLGQANASLLQAGYYGSGYYPGWGWDPYLDAYTWFPADGLFYSPFGFGFYSPVLFYGGFGYGGFYRGGFGGFHGGYGGFHGGYAGGFGGRGGGFGRGR
jgi:hypothetical protein